MWHGATGTKKAREGGGNETHVSIHLFVDLDAERRRSRVVDVDLVGVGGDVVVRGRRVSIGRRRIAGDGSAIRGGRKGGRRSAKINLDFFFDAHCLVRGAEQWCWRRSWGRD